MLGTLGVIYNLGNDVDLDEKEGQTQLQQQLRNATWDETGQPVFTVPVALSVMVFFALCAQCAATLVIIKRETNSWRLAGLHVRLYDHSGLHRSVCDIPHRHLAWRIADI